MKKANQVESTDVICFAEYDMQHNTGELTDMMAHPSLKITLILKTSNQFVNYLNLTTF